MNPTTQKIGDYIYYFSLTAVGGILAYYGWKYNGMTGHVPLAGTNLPSAVLMLPGIGAGVIWAALGVFRIIQTSFSFSKPNTPKNPKKD